MKAKKVWSLLLALALVLGLAACGSSESAETAAPAATASSDAAEEPEAVAIDKDAFDALIASGPVADSGLRR